MQFGVTFYPDQWPKDYWDKAFKEIKEVGFEVVRFLEMAWDWIEPRDNHFQFEELDHALALCEKHKLKVVLGVPTAQAPQWLITKYPEVLHVAHDGFIHPCFGPRPNACRDNPTFKSLAERLTKKLAERYAKHPVIEMWQIDNEPNYPPLDLTHNKDYCHCQATQAAFREWAKNKYKDIDLLNQVWGTRFWTGTFSSFEEITSPKSGMWNAGNPHIYLDWFRFKSESLNMWLKNLKFIVREYDKEHKVGTNSFTSLPNRIADHEILSQKMDWFGWDIYPKGTQNSLESFAQITDYFRSVCHLNGAEFIVSELQGGPNVRWGDPKWVSKGDIKEWVKLLQKHGAKMILFHNWRPPLFGSETGGFGILKADGSPTERLGAIKEIIKELKKNVGADVSVRPKLGPTQRSAPTIQTNIAIIYLRNSDIQTYQEEGLSRPAPPGWFSGRGELGFLFSANSLAGAYRILWDKKVPADFIFQNQLEEGNFSYKILLLTNPYLLSVKQSQVLHEFVSRGGVLVSESRFGLKDENAHLYEKPLLEEFFEVEHKYTEILENPADIKEIKASAFGFRDIVKSTSGISLKYKDGKPALIKKKIGKGQALYATFSLFKSLVKSENRKLVEYLRNEIRAL